MAREQYRHIFLRGLAQTRGYTSPRRHGSEPRIPDRDRAGHSTYLKQRLDRAWAEEQQHRHAEAVVHMERHGAYIEFVGEPGFDLMVQSLEAMGSKIRLLNVRTEGEGDLQHTLATVYVPHNKRGHFLRKIQAYATQTVKGSDKPKNASLVNSISDIHLAVLESFWRSDERSLIPGDTPEWVEAWLSGDHNDKVAAFERLLRDLHVESAEGLLRFPERSVKLILAHRRQLEQLIEACDDIAEFRLARETANFYVELENREQVDLVRSLLGRSTFDDQTGVAVCILDTGVNSEHALIHPVLSNDDLHSVHREWGTNDHNGHGTLMAGTAAYGDLLSILGSTGRVHIGHRLESAKILPPRDQNPKRLWGYITAQGLSLAEIQAPERKRIVCMAITSTDDRNRGRPSSWSGMIDELASGYADDIYRLILVSAGNVDDSDNWRNYPADNKTNEVHDPAQAWNAITVGAHTEKTRISDPTLSGYVPLAPPGGLSPFSTTSCSWSARKWPIKPDVVFEGGNVARGPGGSMFAPDDLQLLSTYHDPQAAQFALFNATSAAAAQAAWMAAQIQTRYSDAWPETIRALIVHAAEWTETMRTQFLDDESKTSYAKLLRVCGYGVPNLQRAIYCAANSLTLISQAVLQPFDKRVTHSLDTKGKPRIETRYVTRDMHLYNLPWPTRVLSALGEVQVTMRVTLSYFVEPGPGEVGWENRYRYASHALRFDVNGKGESEDEFIQRVNHQAREDGEHPGTEGSAENWVIGDARNVGSIHSDIWRGRAADLAACNKVAVYPAIGWWRERHHLNRWGKRCRYSLVISIYTPEQNIENQIPIDIYTPVAQQIGVPIQVETTTNRRT